MPVAIPQLRVGVPVRHQALSVFPLFADNDAEVDYRLSDAALADESILVEEVSDGGSVPDLLVENKSDHRVLFLEGEELVGAKQNRILNTSVLVAAHTKIKIPVSCVEQGRWRYQTRYFDSSGSHSPPKLRKALKSSVSSSLKEDLGHRSDQGEVWKAVACLNLEQGVSSDTEAMACAFRAKREPLADFQDKINYVAGATGVAVAIGQRVVSIDLFDKASTCERVWKRILSGVAMEALVEGEVKEVASVADIEKLLAVVLELTWEQSPAVGDGEEYRAESQQGDHASALTFKETVVHGSVLSAV